MAAREFDTSPYPLPEAERAFFYHALEVNDSAVKVLGDENLRFIACELLKTIRENVSIDWTAKDHISRSERLYFWGTDSWRAWEANPSAPSYA